MMTPSALFHQIRDTTLHANLNTLVTDEDLWAGNQFADLDLPLVAEGAPKLLEGFAHTVIPSAARR
jgi:hypothetical protein